VESMKSTFRDVKPCSPVEVRRLLGGTTCSACWFLPWLTFRSPSETPVDLCLTARRDMPEYSTHNLGFDTLRMATVGFLYHSMWQTFTGTF
jgi:hypothetical protein